MERSVYRINERVALIGGSYKRYGFGKVVGYTEFKVIVKIEGCGKTTHLMKSSVCKLPVRTAERNREDVIERLTREVRELQHKVQRLRLAVEKKQT